MNEGTCDLIGCDKKGPVRYTKDGEAVVLCKKHQQEQDEFWVEEAAGDEDMTKELEQQWEFEQRAAFEKADDERKVEENEFP